MEGRLSERSDVTVHVLDPRELGFGDLVEREFEMKQRPPRVAAFVDVVTNADGFLIVTPEYNHGIPGALKNVLDLTFKPWNHKPFAIVSVGGISGGLRAVEMLRQVISGLQAVSIPAHMPVPFVAKSFGPDGPLSERDEWAKRADRVLDELVWYAVALKQGRSGTITNGAHKDAIVQTQRR